MEEAGSASNAENEVAKHFYLNKLITSASSDVIPLVRIFDRSARDANHVRGHAGDNKSEI